MMRRLAGIAALVALICLGAPAPAQEISCGISGRNPEQQSRLIERFDDYLARERQRRGLHRIAFSRALATIAAKYAHLLDEHDHFDHTGPDGSTPGSRVDAAGYCWRFVAENLAMGGYEDAGALFQAWMDSPGHRDAMMHETPIVYGLAANCPPRRRAGYPPGSIADLMDKAGSLEDATYGADPGAGRPEIFVMLLALPC